MRYGLLNGEKVEAQKGLKNVLCPCCELPLIPKCGKIMIHHWAHQTKKHCDNWWEPETEWHRKWKNHFRPEFQEVVCFDPVTGEKHIADIKLPNGLVIEFQNSPISYDEMRSREAFYGKMIWVVNAAKFHSHFQTSDLLNFDERIIWFYGARRTWMKSKMPLIFDFSNCGIEEEIQYKYKSKEGYEYYKYYSACRLWSNYIMIYAKELYGYINNKNDCGIKAQYFDRRYFIEKYTAYQDLETESILTDQAETANQ
jgi:competence protein CoiA